MGECNPSTKCCFCCSFSFHFVSSVLLCSIVVYCSMTMLMWWTGMHFLWAAHMYTFISGFDFKYDARIFFCRMCRCWCPIKRIWILWPFSYNANHIYSAIFCRLLLVLFLLFVFKWAVNGIMCFNSWSDTLFLVHKHCFCERQIPKWMGKKMVRELTRVLVFKRYIVL